MAVSQKIKRLLRTWRRYCTHVAKRIGTWEMNDNEGFATTYRQWKTFAQNQFCVRPKLGAFTLGT